MCRKVSKMSVTDLQDTYNVSRNAARVMVPSAILFARVVEMTGAATVWTPGTVACDGFAADYAQEQGLIKFDHDFEEDIISSARDLADHYCCHRRRPICWKAGTPWRRWRYFPDRFLTPPGSITAWIPTAGCFSESRPFSMTAESM